MTEKPAPDATNEVFIPVRDLPSAPIIFFEFCPTYGNHNGLINTVVAAGWPARQSDRSSGSRATGPTFRLHPT